MLSLNSEQHTCKLFVNDDLTLILLPCFFSDSLSQHLRIYVTGRGGHISAKPIEETTSKFILNRLEQFLYWIEEYSFESKFVSLDNHHNAPNELINYYLNDVLIVQKGLGEASVLQSIQSLNAYYNYLVYTGLTENIRDLLIKPKYREQARSNTNRRTSVKYLTPDLRNTLYQNTTTIRNELLLKTGGECGLRSKENQGFLLDDCRVGNKTHKGLLSLFDDMDTNPQQNEFEYYLQGRFSKSVRYSGGRSRLIYMHRELLRRFKEYYDYERPKSDSNFFYLNDSNSGDINPISPTRATQTFKEARDKVISLQERGLLSGEAQCLEVDHTHHVLRHSFGTDKFYALSKENKLAVDDVTTTSLVYLTVAALMGHNAVGKSAPTTTRSYIRACHIKQSFESEQLESY